jgi:hypothetical protein
MDAPIGNYEFLAEQKIKYVMIAGDEKSTSVFE